MDELEAHRQKRLAELQAAQAAAGDEQEEAQAQEAVLNRALAQVLAPEARERFERVRMTRPEFATQLGAQLVAMANQGRIKAPLTDQELRALFARMTPPERESTIRRI